MAYDLVVAGASRSARRLDHLAAQFPANDDMEKKWKKVGKSASVLAVCAVLILNAAIALPFNVAARYHEQPPTRTRTLVFKGFLASDAMAFLCSTVATIYCTYAGFAPVGNMRAHYLYVGAGCLMLASLAIYNWCLLLGDVCRIHYGSLHLPNRFRLPVCYGDCRHHTTAIPAEL